MAFTKSYYVVVGLPYSHKCVTEMASAVDVWLYLTSNWRYLCSLVINYRLLSLWLLHTPVQCPFGPAKAIRKRLQENVERGALVLVH